MKKSKLKWRCDMVKDTYRIRVEQIGLSYEQRTYVAEYRLDKYPFWRLDAEGQAKLMQYVVTYIHNRFIQHWK